MSDVKTADERYPMPKNNWYVVIYSPDDIIAERTRDDGSKVAISCTWPMTRGQIMQCEAVDNGTELDPEQWAAWDAADAVEKEGGE